MVRVLVSSLLWPTLLLACISITAFGFDTGHPVLAFNIAYVGLAITLLILERIMPHERAWQSYDGQIGVDIGHTLLGKGLVQGIILFGGLIGLTPLIAPAQGGGLGFWPEDWPLVAQVALGLVVGEFGLYWAHRLAHEHDLLWRVHAVHHSVTRLWVVNTGRFHVLDSLFKISLSFTLLALAGAPGEVLRWIAAVTAFIGFLTHCNVEMRCGPLSYVFSTPVLHRWHHSRDIREGNRNYGENLVVWDLLFGTWFNPARKPPVNIGINDVMPTRFVDQLLYPFRREYYRQAAKAAE